MVTQCFCFNTYFLVNVINGKVSFFITLYCLNCCMGQVKCSMDRWNPEDAQRHFLSEPLGYDIKFVYKNIFSVFCSNSVENKYLDNYIISLASNIR